MKKYPEDSCCLPRHLASLLVRRLVAVPVPLSVVHGQVLGQLVVLVVRVLPDPVFGHHLVLLVRDGHFTVAVGRSLLAGNYVVVFVVKLHLCEKQQTSVRPTFWPLSWIETECLKGSSYADPVAELVKAGVAIQSSEVGGSTLGLAKTADF